MSILNAVLLAGLAAGSVLPAPSRPGQVLRKRNDGDCTGGPWVDPVYVGGYQDGVSMELCETGWPSYGHPIGQINAYCTTEAVRGVNFNYDDPNQAMSIPGGTQTYGATNGPNIVGETLNINYAGGELISSVTMYAPAGAKYLRGLTITTNQGQTLQCGVDASSGFPAQSQDVGTGYLIGVAGDYENGIIDNLGFLFLNSPVASITVEDITITGGPTGTQGITPTSLAQQHFYDGDTTTENWQFSGSKSVTSTTVIMSSIANTYTTAEAVAVMFSGMFLGIGASGGSTTTFTWQQMQGSSTSTTMTVTEMLGWQQSGTLQPNEGITCDSVAGSGSGTFPYSATVTITLKDGVQYAQYKDYGSLYVQAVSSNSVSCNPTQGS